MTNAPTHKFFARLVLVWFALSLGVAMASPLVSPKSRDMVCTSGGVIKWVVSDDGDEAEPTSASMDCPLCAPVHVPLQACNTSFDHASPLAHSLHPVAASLIAAHTAPPLPSRGPPVV